MFFKINALKLNILYFYINYSGYTRFMYVASRSKKLEYLSQSSFAPLRSFNLKFPHSISDAPDIFLPVNKHEMRPRYNPLSSYSAKTL